MRRRFVLYIISAIALVLSLILLLLNLFGVMNPTNARIMEVLDTQLLSYTDSIEDYYDKVAAHALSFSDQIEEALESFLVENNLAFEDLKNNTEALSTLQLELYAACSKQRCILYFGYNRQRSVRPATAQRNLSQIHQFVFREYC